MLIDGGLEGHWKVAASTFSEPHGRGVAVGEPFHTEFNMNEGMTLERREEVSVPQGRGVACSGTLVRVVMLTRVC